MTYDLVVIGSGPGGYVCAIRAAQLGMKVAVVEKRETFGGTCLNIGCIPSKALLHASELFEEAGHTFEKMGIRLGAPKLDLPGMMKFKDEGVDGNVKGIAFLFKKNKIDAFLGTGKILAPGQVEVRAAEAKAQTIETKAIVIATGSDVARLNGIDIDEKRIVSSTGALSLDKVPQRLLVVGAGVIGLELGSVWRRLGSQVVVVEFLDRILPGIDAEVGKQFQRLLERQGMTFKLSSKLTAVDTSGKKLKAKIEPVSGGAAEMVEADVVLVAIGRVPCSEGLGLEAAGVKRDNRGRVVVDRHFASSVPGIYAIGDVIAGPMLAHKAEDEGVAVAEILAGQAGHVNYDVIPNVVYTFPEIASVGKSEEELKEAGIAYRQDPGRRRHGSGARRAYRRRRRRQHDRGGGGGDGVRRVLGGHCAHLPCASDAERGGERGGAGGRQAVDSHVSFRVPACPLAATAAWRGNAGLCQRAAPSARVVLRCTGPNLPL
jgi:dihydrolipoamide dehydrogenase